MQTFVPTYLVYCRETCVWYLVGIRGKKCTQAVEEAVWQRDIPYNIFHRDLVSACLSRGATVTMAVRSSDVFLYYG